VEVDVRHIRSESADTYLVGAVPVARWEQYGLQDTLPFQAMWYTVPPGESSPRDCHPEYELSIVVTGTASVEAGGQITEAGTGSAFLLESEEAHIIHNRGDVPVLIFTTYWLPGSAQAIETAALGVAS
jgi:quercetin dioxygenase-like cupin family protein